MNEYRQIGVFIGCVCAYTPDCKGGFFKANLFKEGACYKEHHGKKLNVLFSFSGRRKFIKNTNGGVNWELSYNHSVPSHKNGIIMEVWEEALDNGGTRYIASSWGYLRELRQEVKKSSNLT